MSFVDYASFRTSRLITVPSSKISTWSLYSNPLYRGNSTIQTNQYSTPNNILEVVLAKEEHTDILSIAYTANATNA